MAGVLQWVDCRKSSQIYMQAKVWIRKSRKKGELYELAVIIRDLCFVYRVRYRSSFSASIMIPKEGG